MEYLTKLLIKHFPHTPVYSSIGNHEGVPVNSFPPPFIRGNRSVTWLYEELVHAWGPWLPNSTYFDISRGGFYTTLIKPGLRIISVNMNYCNNQNWWLLLNSTDPANEIQWLGSTLQKAEDAGEKVHIVGHIPPGVSNCLKAWSWNYYNIISR
ncbi:hypothetical protein CAPTEDRAFT_96075 [Capitella teleta]|nr:hypothetical protein CAPTEDRAFT_96075 [Capitella teleta]|eukprot:ELU17764.1 hypothetical protein CAPTEDRAFT_96075 [Capitella teleta]